MVLEISNSKLSVHKIRRFEIINEIHLLIFLNGIVNGNNKMPSMMIVLICYISRNDAQH